MKKKLFLLVAALMAIGQNAFAYDFFAVSPYGDTLYYKIIDTVNYYVKLTNPNAYIIEEIEESRGFSYYNDIVNNSDMADFLWGDNTQPTGALVLPDTVSYNGRTYTVRAVGPFAFSRCIITSVTMPNTIDSICYGAFHGCSYLTSVTFSDSLRYIGPHAFSGCMFGNMVLPSSVRVLDYAAFQGSYINNITFNDSIQSIGGDCLADNQITSLFIPALVNYIGGNLGSNNVLTSIVVDANNQYYDSRNNCNAIISTDDELIMGCYNTVIPSDVISLAGNAFNGCTWDTLVLPSSVMTIVLSGTHVHNLVISSPQVCIDWFSLYWGSLDTIHFLTDTPPIHMAGCLNNHVRYGTPIIVPCNTLSTYQSAPVWGDFH